MESASLSEYAKFTLKTICSQEWVREIFLKDPEKLWTHEVLLDELLTCKQVNIVCSQDNFVSSNPMESASLSEYAKLALKTICSQEWVREIFLKDPEKLWTPEVLLDEVLTCKQVIKNEYCNFKKQNSDLQNVIAVFKGQV